MENNKTPKIRFKGFTDPWEQRKLANVVDSVDTGKSKFDKEGSSGEYPILGSTSVIGYDEEYDYEGDFILTARVGANAGSLYRHAGKVKISDNTVFIQASQNIEFLYQLLIQFDIKKLSFGTGQPLVKASELKSLELMMPIDMKEQMQIGAYFSEFDNLITLHQRKFEDITFLSGEKNKNNLPYESYSVTNENGFVPQNEQFENGGTMATADKRMYYIVSKNSFAYNPARINVGSIGYYDGSENVIVSSLYEVFKTSEDIDDRYLWHWFKSNNFKKLIEQYQEGGVRLYFYYDKLCMCSLPTPSIQEQVKIGRYFGNLDNLITLHQRELEKLQNIKKSMLEKMFA